MIVWSPNVPPMPWYSLDRYVAFRMLAADVQLDLRSLQKLLGLFQQLDLMAFDEASAEIFPERYIENLRDFYGSAEVTQGLRLWRRVCA